MTQVGKSNRSPGAKLEFPRTRTTLAAVLSALTGRNFVAASAAAGAFGLAVLSAPSYAQNFAAASSTAASAESSAIRPFRVHFPEAGLVDLRARLATTRWPDRETVAPSMATGDFYRKGSAIRSWRERLEFLNRGQRWVAKRIAAALPRIAPSAGKSALQAMQESHLVNIALCEQLLA